MVPIDLRTNTALAPITVGGGPWAVAIDTGRPDRLRHEQQRRDGHADRHRDRRRRPAIGGTPFARGIAITPDQPPAARFTVSRATPGAPARFDASSSTIRFNAITDYAWDFGDGTPVVHTTAPTVTHAYAQAGLRQATLTARGATTASGAATDTFVVGSSALAPPVLGTTELARRSSGTVLVRRRGSRAFVRLTATRAIPTGSELDARHGSVTITVARNTSQQTDAATVSGGQFITTQTRGAQAQATFTLSQRLAGCTTTRATTAKKRRRKGPSRRITVRDTGGHFGTKGRYVAASVEGTRWTTSDTCTTSTVAVSQGVVKVRDLVRHTTHVLGARQSYTARRR